jgi:DNA-binding MarR family transcriptional regulator
MLPVSSKALARMNDYVGLELVLTHRAFRQGGERRLARLGLRLGQELILLNLAAHTGLSQGQMAEQLGVEQATVSIMLRRMERTGFIRRRTDRKDARVTRVCATRKGRALVGPILRLWASQENDLLVGLTDGEKRTLGKLLARVRSNLESKRTHEHGGRSHGH